MPYINDLIDPQQLVGFARDQVFPEFRLNLLLPDVTDFDLEYRFNKGALLDQDAAQYRAFDTPAGIGKRQGVTRMTGELPPLSKKYKLGEEDRLRLREIQSGDNDPLIDQIYDDVANGVRSVRARLELARGSAIYDGKVTIAENGVVADVNFGMPAGHKVTAATLWSDPAAPIIADLTAWVEVFVATNGFPPELALTSQKVFNNMLRNTQIRTLAATVAGVPAIVGRGTLSQVLVEYGLPPIEINDELIQVGGVATRPIPENRFVMLAPNGLGRTIFGVTAEALRQVRNGVILKEQTPGLMAVISETDDPVGTWTKTSGIALPVVPNPQQVLTATVIA
ncbi:MAG: major capsid protein [Actinomycetota bacterium]